MPSEEAEERTCRICYGATNPFSGYADFISPCNCKGSVKYVHSMCLKMWRFKSSFFKEMKICEQCKAIYNCADDKLSHRILISSLSTMAIGGGYLFAVFFFSSFFQVFMMVCDEHQGLDSISISKPPGITGCQYHFTCVMILMTITKISLNPSIFAIFNYLFTFWRIVQFGFTADKALFVAMTLLFFRETFWSIYQKIDRLYFIFLNTNSM